jgi:hypothetical protein
VGIHPLTGHLCWVGGPFPGAMHDLTMTRMGGLLDLLADHEFVMADKGYIGEFKIITPFKGRPHQLLPVQLFWNNYIGSMRWIVEHIIGRLKIFRIINTQYRHWRELHGIVFHVICEIVNIDLYFRPARK